MTLDDRPNDVQNKPVTLRRATSALSDVVPTSAAPASTSAPAPSSRSDLPPKTFAVIASRCRSAGLLLASISPDGAILQVDGAGPEFLVQYAAKLLPFAPWGALLAEHAVANFVAMPFVEELFATAGFVTAVIPRAERRQLVGALLLIARSSNLDEARMEEAIELNKLDAETTLRQRDALPIWTGQNLLNFAQLLAESVRDRAGISTLESQVQSMSQQLSNSYEELNLIYHVSGGNQVNRRPVEFFEQTCREAMQTLGVRALGYSVTIRFPGQPAPQLFGAPELDAAETQRLADDVLVHQRMSTSALLVPDIANHSRFAWLAPRANRLLAVPMRRQHRLLGSLFALDKQVDDFDSADAKLLDAIANESAIYLDNARLFDDVQDLVMGLMHSLTSAVDAKDTYTYGHSERVALLGRHLARESGLSDDEVDQVYMAGLLHDVGKIGVPEAVLQKPGHLTNDEFDQIKRHPAVGAHILQEVRQIRSIIPGVLHHHERYDGRGYPEGRSGDKIALIGRMLCIADSFDAMTSSRTYRRALPVEVALCEIRRCAGTHFDPQLADTFLRTTADGYRELLSDHKTKSRQILHMRDIVRAA